MDENRFTARVAEWSTKNIATMFVGLAKSPQQAKALSKSVDKMRLPLADEINELLDDRTIEEIHEQGARVNLDSQPSFESLSMALGAMTKGQ